MEEIYKDIVVEEEVILEEKQIAPSSSSLTVNQYEQTIGEIKAIKEQLEYSNSLIYIGIVVSGTVFIWCLIYKILKIFI